MPPTYISRTGRDSYSDDLHLAGDANVNCSNRSNTLALVFYAYNGPYIMLRDRINVFQCRGRVDREPRDVRVQLLQKDPGQWNLYFHSSIFQQ